MQDSTEQSEYETSEDVNMEDAHDAQETDPDWSSSLHAGHKKPRTKKPKEQKAKAVRGKFSGQPTSDQNECCVLSCGGRSHNDRGQRIRNNLTFYSFPIWRRNEGVFVSDLSKRRREAWVRAVGRADITFDDVSDETKVCSRHFVSGKPAYGMTENDPDWAPSLHLNKEPQIVTDLVKPKRSLKKRLNQTEADEGTLESVAMREDPDWAPTPTGTRHRSHLNNKEPETVESPVKLKRPSKKMLNQTETDKERPGALPWKDVESRLQGLMQQKSQPSEIIPVVDNPQSFEEFFRNALKASLDSCLGAGSRSAAESRLSSTRLSSTRLSSTRLSSTRLSSTRLSSTRLSSTRLSSTRLSSTRTPQSCENCTRLKERIFELEERLATPHHILEQWTEPLSQTDLDRHRRPPLVNQTSPPKTDFKPNLLKRHWFLRYSPKLNSMWCHVCRLYAAKHLRHTAFVVGTQVFLNHAVVQHSQTSNHRECVMKFKARKSHFRQ